MPDVLRTSPGGAGEEQEIGQLVDLVVAKATRREHQRAATLAAVLRMVPALAVGSA